MHRKLLLPLALLLAAPLAYAQPNPTTQRSKVDPTLLRLADPDAAASKAGAAAGYEAYQETDEHLLMRDGQVAIHALAAGSTGALLADLRRLGLEDAAAEGVVVTGWLPEDQVGALDALASLRSVRAVYAKTNVGLVTSQGDTNMNTDDVRTQTGFDGSGLEVGVLSDSYDALGGAAGDVASNDLPPGIDVLEEFPFGTDEGRAMMQLIHDVAPGADQAFHTAIGGELNFARGILELRANGADVIVDDVFYFAEPMFVDGVINQAIEAVVADGGAYFTAAGNSGRDAYEAPFRPSGVTFGFLELPSLTPFAPSFFGGEAHDFDPGPGVDVVQTFDVSPSPDGVVPGAQIDLVFQWVDNYFSVFGEFPENELDFYLVVLDDAENPVGVIGGSATFSTVADPIEIESGITYSGEDPAKLGLMILRDGFFTAPGAEVPPLIKYVNLGFGFEAAEYDTQSGALWGHANAEGAHAIGASFYFRAPPFQSPAIINSYSSAGPTPIYFKEDGTRIAPEIRMKPDVVGPDATNTTFFIPGFDFDSDGFPNFTGTSAAAPHVAALGALILDADPSLTPQQIYDLLEATARDMDDPLTPGFDEGFDFKTGYGFVDALGAFNELDTCDPDFRITDFDADGVPDGEFIEFTNVGDDPALLGGCTVLVFDPFTEDVTLVSNPPPFVIPPGGIVGFSPGAPDQIPDGPGAFGLFDLLSVEVGTDVTEVLGDQVAAVVYFDEDNLVGTFPAPSKGGDFVGAMRTLASAVAAGSTDALPETFALGGNYPNPFNPATEIGFQLPESAHVSLVVYDLLGRPVATLVDGVREAGAHRVRFDARALPSGTYLYRFEAGSFADVKQMTLVK